MTTCAVGAGDEGHLAVTCMWVCEFFLHRPCFVYKNGARTSINRLFFKL